MCLHNIYKQYLMLFVFVFCCNMQTKAQTPADLPWSPGSCNGETTLLQPGVAVVTCGVTTAVPEGENYAMGFMSVNGAIPNDRSETTNMDSVYHHPSWKIDQIGNIFGVAINSSTGEVLVTASSNFGSGFFSQEAVLNYGTIGSPASDTEAAGTVYRIDPITGEATVFVRLYQQTVDLPHLNCEDAAPTTRTNTGVGLGNVAFDKTNNQYFVTNVEDGRIYRLSEAGVILDSYDPFTYDDAVPGISILEEIPYGIAVENDGSRVFFGVPDINEDCGSSCAGAGDPGIFSIDLMPDGSFAGTIDDSYLPPGAAYNNYVGTETLHTNISLSGGSTYADNAVYFTSDLTFDPNDNLLVGIRVGCNGVWFSSYNHWGQTSIITKDGTTNVYNASVTTLDISVTGDAGDDDAYGGVAVYELPNGEVHYAASSADILQESGPHGIAIWNSTTTNAPVSPLGALSYGAVDSGDPKGVGGDIDIFSYCTPPACPVITALTDNNAGDYCYTDTAIDITYTLTTDKGTNDIEYMVKWFVDGVEQLDETADVLTLSFMPVDGCTPFVAPAVSATVTCVATGTESPAFNNTSGNFTIYPMPVAGVDYVVTDNACTVSITDNCGTLLITNDIDGNDSYSINVGDADASVNFTVSSDVNAPANCAATEMLLATCSCTPISITATANNTCEGGNVQLGVDDGFVSYAWSGPDGFSATEQNPLISGAMSTATGDYMVTVTDANDCTAVATIGVTVQTALNPEEICPNETLELIAEAGFTSYQWYKDGVAIDGATAETYITTEPGEYNYTVNGALLNDSCANQMCCPILVVAGMCEAECLPNTCLPVTFTKIE